MSQAGRRHELEPQPPQPVIDPCELSYGSSRRGFREAQGAKQFRHRLLEELRPGTHHRQAAVIQRRVAKRGGLVPPGPDLRNWSKTPRSKGRRRAPSKPPAGRRMALETASNQSRPSCRPSTGRRLGRATARRQPDPAIHGAPTADRTPARTPQRRLHRPPMHAQQRRTPAVAAVIRTAAEALQSVFWARWRRRRHIRGTGGPGTRNSRRPGGRPLSTGSPGHGPSRTAAPIRGPGHEPPGRVPRRLGARWPDQSDWKRALTSRPLPAPARAIHPSRTPT